MKILLDMNLSPLWVNFLREKGHEVLHWMNVGAGNDSDLTILSWTRESGYVLFTHDLDFGAILAATKMLAPSVVQIRTQDITPQNSGTLLLNVIEEFSEVLAKGALISVDEENARVRLLPVQRD